MSIFIKIQELYNSVKPETGNGAIRYAENAGWISK
jgi:hypothetical protein